MIFATISDEEIDTKEMVDYQEERMDILSSSKPAEAIIDP